MDQNQCHSWCYGDPQQIWDGSDFHELGTNHIEQARYSHDHRIENLGEQCQQCHTDQQFGGLTQRIERLVWHQSFECHDEDKEHRHYHCCADQHHDKRYEPEYEKQDAGCNHHDESCTSGTHRVRAVDVVDVIGCTGALTVVIVDIFQLVWHLEGVNLGIRGIDVPSFGTIFWFKVGI